VVLGIIAAAAVVGSAYTLYRVVLEGFLLQVSGARRPSRREAQFLIRATAARRRALGDRDG
jgi:hypothetical protein